MEHSCYQCGTAVEDGIAFCPQCSAPQIRVAGIGTIPEVAVDTEALLHSAAYRDPGTAGIKWRRAMPPAAFAGLLAALVMVLPQGAFGLGMFAAGALSVLLYRRRDPAANLTPGMGARLGAVSGVLGFVIFAILVAIEMALMHDGGEMRAAFLQAVQQQASRNPGPQSQQLMQYLNDPQGLAVIMVMGLIVMFFVFVILSSLGGALGAALLRRKNRVR